MDSTNLTAETKRQKIVEKLAKKIWDRLGKGPHNVNYLEDQILNFQDLLHAHDVNRLCPGFSLILQKIKEWNTAQIFTHFQTLSGRLGSLVDWQSSWLFLPLRSNFERFVKKHQERKFDRLLVLQREILVDIISSSSLVPRKSNQIEPTCALADCMLKIKSQSDFMFEQWKQIIDCNQGRPQIQMANSTLTKKATAIFNMERVLSVGSVLTCILRSEFHRLGLTDNCEYEALVEFTKLEWSVANFFKDQWQVIINRFLDDYFEELAKSFRLKRNALSHQLTRINFNKIDGLVEYGLALSSVSQFYDRRIAELYQDFQFDQDQHAVVQDMIREMLNQEYCKLEEISQHYLSKYFKFLDPMIIKFLEYEDLALFRGLFSKTTLQSLADSVAKSGFNSSVKDPVIKHFLEEIAFTGSLEEPRPNGVRYDTDDFIGQSVYIFMILMDLPKSEQTIKNYLNQYFRVRRIFSFMVGLAFPFIKKQSFFKSLCSRIMANKYSLLTRQKCLLSFHDQSEKKNRSLIESIKVNQNLSHNYLIERSLWFRSTLFISGYLSEGDKKTKESWKKLQQFFSVGNLISLNWNSTTEQTVKEIFKTLLKKIAISIATCDWAYVVLGIFFSISKLIKQNVSLFTKTYDTALEEGRLSYQIVKATRAENDRALNLTSFSLGTIYTFAFLQEAALDLTDPLIIDDVYLMGACLDQDRLEELLLPMLAPNSFFKGTVYVVHSKKDWVLKYFFKCAFRHLAPLGIEGFDHQRCCDKLMAKDILLFDTSMAKASQPDPRQLMLDYLRRRIVNIDVTYSVGGHLSYRSKLQQIFAKICVEKINCN